MKRGFLVSSLLLLVAVSQCDTLSNKTSNPLLGRYELAGRDNSGRLAFTGTISFMSLEQNHLKGQWPSGWGNCMEFVGSAKILMI